MTIDFRPRTEDEMSLEKVLYTKQAYRATVTINRPEKHNALDHQTLTELVRALDNASWDDEVAVVIVTGAGEQAFSTGADLSEWEDSLIARPHDYWKWFGAFQDMHDRLRNLGKPTIARLNGMVVGGGNEINIACDLAVAADDVTFRQVGTARGSVPAGGATQWLPIIIGDRRAREMLFLCEEIPAPTALEWGLVNRVVPRSELDAVVDALAEQLYNKLRVPAIHQSPDQLLAGAFRRDDRSSRPRLADSAHRVLRDCRRGARLQRKAPSRLCGDPAAGRGRGGRAAVGAGDGRLWIVRKQRIATPVSFLRGLREQPGTRPRVVCGQVKEVSTMCLTCGCGEPGDQHDDSGHITIHDLKKAAGAGEISVKEAYENMKATVAKIDLDKEQPVKA